MNEEGVFAGMDDLDSAKTKPAASKLPEAKKRKKASKSPTQRSLAHMRAQGYECAVVEKWNAFIGRRQDLFGFIDVICLKDGETVAVQATDGTHVSKRVEKIADSDKVAAVRKAGWRILVQGWRRNSAGKYVLREVDCS
jgi:hypothetical protein